MCLAQGQNPVMPVRLEPTTHWSRVKHSITEPLHSLLKQLTFLNNTMQSLYNAMFEVHRNEHCFM